MEELQLEKAQAVVDKNGFFLNPGVLENLEKKDVVRIAYFFPNSEDDSDHFNSDSPYVEIADFFNDEIVGEILDINHTESENKYPIRAGERIWFKRENIFEINTEEIPADRQNEVQKYILEPKKHVRVTGISFLIQDQFHKSS